MKVIKTLIFLTIILGVCAVALNIALGNQTILFVQKVRFANLNAYYYKFDFWTYIKNIEMSITDVNKLNLSLPTRTWQQLDALNFGEQLGNNMALILDYIILIINVLLYPFRIGGYVIKNILAIMGVNTTESEYNGLYWLIQLVDWLIARVEIPYI